MSKGRFIVYRYLDASKQTCGTRTHILPRWVRNFGHIPVPVLMVANSYPCTRIHDLVLCWTCTHTRTHGLIPIPVPIYPKPHQHSIKTSKKIVFCLFVCLFLLCFFFFSFAIIPLHSFLRCFVHAVG